MIEQGKKLFLLVSPNVINVFPRRYRYKPKWAVQLKSKSNCQKALDHFDAFYKPLYGDLWPSVRLSLLSLPKHCAVLNNFSDTSKVSSYLEGLGCINILQHLKTDKSVIEPSFSSVSKYCADQQFSRNFEQQSSPSSSQDSSISSEVDLENTSEYELRQKKGPAKLQYILSADSLEPFNEDLYKDDLEAFVPPEALLSDKDQQIKEEVQAISFQNRDIDVDVIPMEPINIPKELKVFAFPEGDVSRFPQPKTYNKRTGYYLMDAGSTLPIIAMNVQPSDHILDLCAAPGGKSLAMMQTVGQEDALHLHCNDASQGRLARLKNVLSSYLPNRSFQSINITCMDGVGFQAAEFDKVLVDVPCNSDRHVVTEEDNNLFKQSRTRERLQMMQIQTNLLVNAIQHCRKGGSVVYSTCTMAPAQNDGVIQAAVELLTRRTKVKVAVEDLTPVSQVFEEHFYFYNKCRFGQLILPSVSNNFGPTYFAKLRRIL